MFRTSQCSSSGDQIVLIHHLVWVVCVSDCLVCWSGLVCRVEWNSTLHTRQSSIQNNKYHLSHKYRCFSWWWAHSRPKHVEKRNKHTKKNCALSWLYSEDSIFISDTVMHTTCSSRGNQTREPDTGTRHENQTCHLRRWKRHDRGSACGRCRVLDSGLFSILKTSSRHHEFRKTVAEGTVGAPQVILRHRTNRYSYKVAYTLLSVCVAVQSSKTKPHRLSMVAVFGRAFSGVHEDRW